MFFNFLRLIKNDNYIKFIFIVLSGLIFGYQYRNEQLNLLTKKDKITWFGFSEYFFYLLIGILFSLFLFQIAKTICLKHWEKNCRRIVYLFPSICLMFFPSYFNDYGIQYSLQIIIFFLIILTFLSFISNWKTYNQKSQAIIIANAKFRYLLLFIGNQIYQFHGVDIQIFLWQDKLVQQVCTIN